MLWKKLLFCRQIQIRNIQLLCLVQNACEIREVCEHTNPEQKADVNVVPRRFTVRPLRSTHSDGCHSASHSVERIAIRYARRLRALQQHRQRQIRSSSLRRRNTWPCVQRRGGVSIQERVGSGRAYRSIRYKRIHRPRHRRSPWNVLSIASRNDESCNASYSHRDFRATGPVARMRSLALGSRAV